MIGTNASGTLPIGNVYDGVDIDDRASGNTIGGSSLSAGNVISANGRDGVAIGNAGTSGNVVQANRIGTTADGRSPLGNAMDGVEIVAGATSNLIGDSIPAGRNIISANGSYGVDLFGDGTDDNAVDGNFIGVDSTGKLPLGNSGDGVFLRGGPSGNIIGAPIPGAENVISANGDTGVSIADAGTSGNVVGRNFIGTDVTGTVPLGNLEEGVTIYGGATGNVIGGDLRTSGNFISANGFDDTLSFPGVEIAGGGTTGNIVEHDVIGLGSSGSQALGNAGSGVVIYGGAADNVIGGTGSVAAVLISANDGDGVLIIGLGTSNNVVAGDRIGTDISGTLDRGNQKNGVEITEGATDNLIGASIPGAANLISGNYLLGVAISEPGTSDNALVGNFIGTDFNGALPLGNFRGGVAILDGANHNLIGSTEVGGGNFISGNGFNGTYGQMGAFPGVFINGVGSTFNLVQQNTIGLAAGGESDLANAADGIEISGGASENVIGGSTSHTANVISANLGNGVEISGVGTTGDLVVGNFIGTDTAGTKPLGNDGEGVLIHVAASGNTIGGTSAGAGNVIAFNGGNGVTVGSSTTDRTTGDAVLGNSIFSNAKLGIDLADNGVTHNNASGHTGPNLFQDFPVLTSAISSAAGTTISGTAYGAPNSELLVEIFANASADPSGFGQGQVFLKSIPVRTDAFGNVSFSVQTAKLVPTERWISATATDPAGNTSEFSADFLISHVAIAPNASVLPMRSKPLSSRHQSATQPASRTRSRPT